MIDPQKLPRAADYIEDRLQDADRRAEFEAEYRALNFGVQVCMRREELNLRQKDMEQFGISQETISRIEHGRLPDQKTQPKLARALNSRIIISPDGGWTLEPVDVAKAA